MNPELVVRALGVRVDRWHWPSRERGGRTECRRAAGPRPAVLATVRTSALCTAPGCCVHTNALRRARKGALG